MLNQYLIDDISNIVYSYLPEGPFIKHTKANYTDYVSVFKEYSNMDHYWIIKHVLCINKQSWMMPTEFVNNVDKLNIILKLFNLKIHANEKLQGDFTIGANKLFDVRAGRPRFPSICVNNSHIYDLYVNYIKSLNPHKEKIFRGNPQYDFNYTVLYVTYILLP